MKLTSKAIGAANDAQTKAIWSRNAAVCRAILRCKHRDVRECDYKAASEFFHADPPHRICMCCGLSEVGWGCGFMFLKIEYGRIQREQLFALRTFSIDEDLKGKIRSGKVGLATALQRILPSGPPSKY